MRIYGMNKTDELMRRASENGVFPGGVLLVAKGHKVVFHEAYGFLDYNSSVKVTTDTIYDLASLTKPLVTTLAIAKLVEDKRLSFEDCVGDILPPFSKTNKRCITIRQLLTHRSGLPAHRTYYEKLMVMPIDKRVSSHRELLVKESLENPIGYKTVYSDLGFMILSWIVEECSGKPIDSFVSENIFSTLKKESLYFRKDDVLRGDNVAPTEDCSWRKKVLCGEVHDDNAFAVGGVDGHAGLFGTSEGVFALLNELLFVYEGAIGDSFLKQSTVEFIFAKDTLSGRAIGFDKPSGSGSSSGKYFSKLTVGHLGFTGTSFWMDLKTGIIVILLTNRVHPSRDNIKIRTFRPLIHNQVMEELGGMLMPEISKG